MADESAPSEEQAPEIEEAPPAPEPEQRSGAGPGLVLGVLAGAIAGALAARLLAPREGDGPAAPAGQEAGAEGLADSPGARVASMLGLVRARMQEASREAREAAQTTEGRLRARYSELTGGDGHRG